MENSAIIYIRVSTGDQENSLELQEKSLRQYCSIKNLSIASVIIDEDVSGFKPLYKRKGGSTIPELLSTTKIIVAMKPDRLFRNLKDALITVDEWNEEKIALHLVDVGGAQFRTDTAIGRLMFSTIISFSEFERNITGERIKAISTDKKANGKVYSRPILGFDSIEGALIPNPKEQAIITIIKSLTRQNHMPKFICDFLNERGHLTKNGMQFKVGTIQYILKNPIYNQPSHNRISSPKPN
jgi:DNA invertase Pin-like site-specific DNA recombinase